MRLYWIKGEPKTQWEFPYKRQGEKKKALKKTQREEGHIKTEAEPGVMLSKAQNH